jgi:hypothetical protein
MRDVEAERHQFNIQLSLPTVLHEELRLLALEADRPMTYICRALVVEGLRRRREKPAR